MTMKRGLFLTLEGVDGAGKSTHVQWMVDTLVALGQPVLCTREPGGTPIGEQLRSLLLHEAMTLELGTVRIEALERWVHPDFQPDITWLFDVPLEVARERLNRTRDKDRFEQEADAFFLRTRQVYLERAAQQAARFSVVDSTQPIDAIRVQLHRELVRLVNAGSVR